MTVFDAIAEAESLLHLKPVEKGKDPRWQAIIKVGEFIESEPEMIWAFICESRQTNDEDLQQALACCLLEDLIEAHPEYKSRAQDLASRDTDFQRLFEICWIK
jgi:hypothetical protein